MVPATSERIEHFNAAVSVLFALDDENSPNPIANSEFFFDIARDLDELCEEALEALAMNNSRTWEEVCDCVRQSVRLVGSIQDYANSGTLNLATLSTPENLEHLHMAAAILNCITHTITNDRNRATPSINEVDRERLVAELKAAINLLDKLHLILAHQQPINNLPWEL